MRLFLLPLLALFFASPTPLFAADVIEESDSSTDERRAPEETSLAIESAVESETANAELPESGEAERPNTEAEAETAAPAVQTAPDHEAVAAAVRAEQLRQAAEREAAERELRLAAAAERVNALLRQELDALVARTAAMEQFYTAQYDREIALYRDTIAMVVTFGIAFAVVAGLGLLAAAYLNYRALMAVQVVMVQRNELGAASGNGETGLLTVGERNAGMERVQASGQRFHTQMSSLDRRLSELEHIAAGRDQTEITLDDEHAPIVLQNDEQPEPPPRRAIPRAAILAHKAQALLNLGKLDDALTVLDEAGSLDDATSDVYLTRGKVLEKLGRLDDAIRAYDQAAEDDETVTNALLMKAGVLNRQERYNEALECYEQALAAHRLTS